MKTLLNPVIDWSVQKATVGIIVLVLLAGCGGQGPPSDNSQTTKSVSLDEVSYPPGISESGIEDVDTLLQAHRKAVSQTDYEVSSYRSYLVTFSDGEQRRFQTWSTTRSDHDDERAKTIYKRKGWVGDGRNGTYTIYSVNGTHFRRANLYFSRHYNTSEYRTTFGSMHNSTTYLNQSLNNTLSNGTLTPIEAFSNGDDTFIRFRISFPGRDVSSGTVVIREDGLIKRINAPDGSTVDDINDGVDRYSLTVKDDVKIEPISWKDKARQEVTEQLRDPVSGDGSGSACNNDGDQSYNEDNDRDNDGICDEG